MDVALSMREGTKAPKKRTSAGLRNVPSLTSTVEATLVSLRPSLKSVFAFVRICKKDKACMSFKLGGTRENQGAGGA